MSIVSNPTAFAFASIVVRKTAQLQLAQLRNFKGLDPVTGENLWGVCFEPYAETLCRESELTVPLDGFNLIYGLNAPVRIVGTGTPLDGRTGRITMDDDDENPYGLHLFKPLRAQEWGVTLDPQSNPPGGVALNPWYLRGCIERDELTPDRMPPALEPLLRRYVAVP